MSFIDRVKNRLLGTDRAEVMSANDLIPVAPVDSALPGMLTPQTSFQDGTDGKPSLVWARYQGSRYSLNGYFGGTPGADVSRERNIAAGVALDLYSSNATVAAITESAVVYIVGNGLTLSSRINHTAIGITEEQARELENTIEQMWDEWVNNPLECDATGRHTLHQQAAAIVRAFLLTGEAVATLDWLHVRSATTRTKCRVLDSRQLDQTITKSVDRGNVYQGVEFDQNSSVRGYWLLPNTLGNNVQAPQAVFVPAYTSWGCPKVIHLFDLLMGGQIRGLSPLTPALSAAHSKATLREFALISALVQSMVGVSIESDLPSREALGTYATNDPMAAGHSPNEWLQAKEDFYKSVKIDLTPGVVNHLLKGDKLRLHRAESPNNTYDSFDKSLNREAARAAGAAYEDVSGDFSSTSYSGARYAAELPWRITLRRRNAIAVPFYRAVYHAWLEEQIETGRLPLPHGALQFWEAPGAYSRAAFRGDGKPVADPYKQALADELELALGTSTYEQKLSERGMDAEQTLATRKREREQHQTAGLPYPAPRDRLADPQLTED